MVKLDWWVYLIIATCILLFLSAVGIIQYLYKQYKLRRGTIPNDQNKDKQTKLNNQSEVKINNTNIDDQKELPIDPFKARYFGIYNGFGSKTAIRWETLVYVKPKIDSCPLCAKFENSVLSLAKKSKEYTTMSEAVAQGYHHVGCSHRDINYMPFETKIEPKDFTDKQQKHNFELRLKHYRLEDEMRKLNLKLTTANNRNEQLEIKKEKKNQAKKIQNFCLENNISRSLKREKSQSSDVICWS